MKTNFYILLENLDQANKLLARILEITGEVWSEPIENPFNSRVAIPWNIDHLKECENLISGIERLSLDEVLKAGFPVGYHKGRFAQASQKLEEAQFILDGLHELEGNPNFPLIRSLFYGLQSTIFATREALKKACRKSGCEAAAWWKRKDREITHNEPLIQKLHIDYNQDKHGDATGILVPRFNMYEYKGPPPDAISGEGVYTVINRGTPQERRVFTLEFAVSWFYTSNLRNNLSEEKMYPHCGWPRK